MRGKCFLLFKKTLRTVDIKVTCRIKVKYTLLTGYLKSTISITGAPDYHTKLVELYDSQINILGIVTGLSKEYRDTKDDNYLSDILKSETGAGTVVLFTQKKDKFFFKGITALYQRGIRQGIVVVSQEFNIDTLNEIKKMLNREVILAKNNKIILSTIYNGSNNVKDIPINLKKWKNNNDYIETKIQNKKMVLKFIPIVDYDGNEILKLGIGFYSDEIKKLYESNIKIFIFTLVAFSSILFLILFFILKNIFLPFNRILENITKIKEGDYDLNLDLKADGEIKKIGQSISELAVIVMERERTLKEYEAEKQKRIFTENLIEFSKSLSNSLTVKDIFTELDKELRNYIKFNNIFALVSLEDNKYIFDNGGIKSIIELDMKESYRIMAEFTLENMILKNVVLFTLRYKDVPNAIIILELGNFEIIEDDIKLVLALLNHAAFAIENIRLFDNTIETKKLETMVNFSKSIIHEVRTPLVSIIGYAELTKKKSVEEKILRYMELIIKESKRIDLMTKDIIDYANIKDVSFEKTEVNLTSILNNIIMEFEGDLSGNQIRMKFDNSKNYFIKTNENQISKAIKSIIKNAIEASDYRKDEKSIDIKLEKMSEKIKMIIMDNGVGIKEVELKKVFLPMFSTKLQGTGLGLTIAKGIIEKLNGSIEIKSEENSFTVVEINL